MSNPDSLDDNDIEQIDSDEEDLIDSEDDDITVDPLQTFLAALNLTEYWPLFKKEEMDLEGYFFCLCRVITDTSTYRCLIYRALSQCIPCYNLIYF